MKPTEIILSLIVVVLTAVIVLGVLELKKEDDLKQATIDGLKRANKKEADSLTRNLKATQDSLQTAFATIRQATKDRELAHERSQKTIENLRKIIFVQHNDSSRNAELTKLYPSFKP